MSHSFASSRVCGPFATQSFTSSCAGVAAGSPQRHPSRNSAHGLGPAPLSTSSASSSADWDADRTALVAASTSWKLMRDLELATTCSATGRPPEARMLWASLPPRSPTVIAAGHMPSDEPMITDSKAYRPVLLGGPSSRTRGPAGELFVVGVAVVANGMMTGSSSALPITTDPPIATDSCVAVPIHRGWSGAGRALARSRCAAPHACPCHAARACSRPLLAPSSTPSRRGGTERTMFSKRTYARRTWYM
mmetsp:Transcript_28184/g.42534  ORF Transcript_28184/g.42534 Transcript_28184/m.42534 type:complete len:249 (-) Transcript_28184:2-748(-)